jgi:mannose-6-phosphate isomerase-like protein (cupin superfamily)
MTERIYKTWGQRIKLHEDDLSETCYLILNPRQRCSFHNHDAKANFFYVIDGKLTVTTEWGEVTLGPNESFTVFPPDKHEFSTGKLPTKIIEVAFVRLNPEDINRDNIGGSTENLKENLAILKGFNSLVDTSDEAA